MFVKNTRKTPVVIPDSSGAGAGAVCEAKGFKSANGVTEISARDWEAFRRNWLGQHCLETGWLSETDEKPRPILPESERNRDDEPPRAA